MEGFEGLGCSSDRTKAGEVVKTAWSSRFAMNEKRYRPSSQLCRKAQREFHISFEGFIRDLRRGGYSPDVVRSYGRAVEHFRQWLCKKGIRPHRIVPIHICVLVRSRCDYVLSCPVSCSGS